MWSKTFKHTNLTSEASILAALILAYVALAVYAIARATGWLSTPFGLRLDYSTRRRWYWQTAHLWSILRLRRKMVFLGLGLGIAIAILVTATTPRLYASKATVQPPALIEICLSSP